MKHLKLITFWTICSLFLFGCEPTLDTVAVDFDNHINLFTLGPVCNGKPIMKYGSLDEIQQAHRNLYNDFQTTEDEEILNIWEQDRHFYSLRKKDEDMDNGLIPDDPNFDSWSYTSDIIMETMLNEDGMVIIDGYLYLWDDGCVIHRIPYNGCSDYQTMLKFAEFIKHYNGSASDQAKLSHFRNDKNISDINTCNDNRFDFETISAEGLDIKNDKPNEIKQKSSACGLEAYITHTILDNDAINSKMTIELKANFIKPSGTNPLPAFYISNASDFPSVKIIGGSIPSSNSFDWSTGGYGYAYPGDHMIIEVDYSTYSTAIPLLLVDLVGTINPLSGDSCTDKDTLALNINCPISISKEPIDAANGKWKFTVEGIGNVQNYGIIWDFGDNSPSETVMNGNSVIHTFPVPCYKQDFNVTASIEKLNLCMTSASTTMSSWDTCKRQTMSEVFKDKVDGKRLKLKIKIKKRWDIFGGTKIVHKFRYRKNGTKTATPVGSIYTPNGNTCVEQNISSLVQTSSQSGKKRLKQRYVNNNDYLIDLSNPYSVKFSHSNGFNHTLTFVGTCSH